MTPFRLERNISKTAGDGLLWGSTVNYPSDSLACCLFVYICFIL